jgi:hypothetical protein
MHYFNKDRWTVINPIHTFFDGTMIDMSSILDVSKARISNPEDTTGNQIVEFAITYKGYDQRRLFQYKVKELVDCKLLDQSFVEAWWSGVGNIGQIANEAIDLKIGVLVDAWAEFRMGQLAVQREETSSEEKDDFVEKRLDEF